MFTRKRFRAPNPTGDDRYDLRALIKALNDYLLSLEDKGALQIDEAQITAAQGIKFPATQVASTDVNTLDDYEESAQDVATTVAPGGGAFTATGAYTYTKVGNLVTISRASVTITNVGTGTGVIDIDVPFVPIEPSPVAAVNATSNLGLAGFVFNSAGQGKIRIFKPDGTTAIAVATLVAEVSYRV